MIKASRRKKTLNAKLFVRILPTLDFSYDSIKIEGNKKVLYVRCLQDLTKGVQVKNPNYWCFCTDGIFWNASQDEVYEKVTDGLYDELLDGVKAMILCFGQTGTGKTFTTSGLRFQFPNRGLILRILSQLFDEEEKRRDTMKITFGISYVEFIGEGIRDLISNKKICSVREAIEYAIPNEAWAWKQIFDAECRKSFSESAPYKGSNRGHSVLTFYAHAESLIDTDPVITHSKIHVVDMGGFDNYGNEPSAWKSKFDLSRSNLSKTLMEQLILCLTRAAWKVDNHICPFKASRFLMHLNDTLQPKSIIRFVAHIHGNDANLPLTISTLKFGERILCFKPTKLERVYETNFLLRLKNIERDYLRLKDEAELTAMLNDVPEYSFISQERFREINRAAEAFLFGQLENLTLLSLGQATLTLEVFRDLYQKLSAEKDQVVKEAVAAAKEMFQAQLASERISSTSNQLSLKLSRRKSRQQESQVSVATSLRTTESEQVTIERALSVGTTDRKGISVGPGKSHSSYEGNVTKAFKKLKSRKSDSITIKTAKSASTKDVAIPPTKNQSSEENSEISLAQVPLKESAWQNFIDEKGELVNELRLRIDTHEEGALNARRKYTSALADLAKLREEIEECKIELENCQHIRQICGKGEYDDEGNLVPGESEINFMITLAQKEEQVNVAIENCHVALADFRTSAEDLNEAKRNLEETFQDFCQEQYKITYMAEEYNSSENKSETSGKDTALELELKNKDRMELYLQLQEKFLNYVPKYRRKEWTSLF